MQTARTASANMDLPDNELAQQIAHGNQELFCQLMRRSNRILYRTARSILKDDHEAEEAVQEAYLRAYQAMKEFRGEAKLSTWLVRIVINESLSRLRKRNRSSTTIHWTMDMDANTTLPDMNASHSDSPEHAAVRAEMRHVLEAAIDRLPDNYRTVFILRALEDLDVEEVAQCLALPAATVRTRFFRARGLLREALSQDIDRAFDDAFGFAGARCDRIVAGVMARLPSKHGA